MFGLGWKMGLQQLRLSLGGMRDLAKTDHLHLDIRWGRELGDSMMQCSVWR